MKDLTRPSLNTHLGQEVLLEGGVHYLGRVHFALGSLTLEELHFELLLLADWREVVLNDLVLPVADGPLPNISPVRIVHIINVHPRVVVEVAHGEFVEFLCEGLVVLILCDAEGVGGVVLLFLYFVIIMLAIRGIRCISREKLVNCFEAAHARLG